MNTAIAQFILAFFEGFALIISPCILPILPIILSGSLEGGKKRPLGIVCGFIIFFSLFTFFSRKIVLISGIDLNLIRNISFGLLVLIGLILISNYLSEKFTALTEKLANIGSSFSSVNNPQGGFASGLLFGGLIGLIWTPCAGPLLAAVIVQTVLQKETLSSFLIILSFSIGTGLPMLLIALLGRKIMARLNIFRGKSSLLRKILGIIIILSVIVMMINPGFLLANNNSTNDQATASASTSADSLLDGLSSPYPAPAITGINNWINSAPLAIQQLKGKLVLIDFWAYSCINCIRTLPYLKHWYEEYHQQGLVIIGIHSPEFDFEKDVDNVKRAVKQFGILYPVALDNQFSTWQNFNNHYWPAHYLIDQHGQVVYQHFGEGDYDITENNIRYLLKIHTPPKDAVIDQTPHNHLTPETYLGYARSENFSSPESIAEDQTATYGYPSHLPENAWALQGQWKIAKQKIIAAGKNSEIKIHFYATKVFAVMGSASGKPIQVQLHLQENSTKNNHFIVDHYALYTLVELEQALSATLTLTATDPGLEVYTFTFG